MSMFVSGALVLAKQHFTTVKRVCKIMSFQELFIWLAREHQLSQLIDAPGRSCWLLGVLWAPMVTLGGIWRKYMKTIYLLSKTHVLHSQRLFWTSPKTYLMGYALCRRPPIIAHCFRIADSWHCRKCILASLVRKPVIWHDWLFYFGVLGNPGPILGHWGA